MNQQDKLTILRNSIKSYPDFPKKGVLFRDLFSVMGNIETLKILMELLDEYAHSLKIKIDAVVGLESKGFLLGPHVSMSLNVPFIPIRKKGKLPGELAKIDYKLEYGTDTFEVQRDSLKPGQTVLIVDDLLATGGTLEASCKLMEELGVSIAECFVITELLDLKGREKLKYPVHALIQY